MNQFKYIFYIILLSSFFISGCCPKKTSIKAEDIEEEVWIYDSNSLPDSIKNFTDNYLIFDKSLVNMNNHYIGEFTISNDTLRIFETSSVLLKGKYQDRVRYQFVGLIVRADSNQIVLKKISGYFPIMYNGSTGDFDKSQVIRLTNQKMKKRRGVHFNYVSIASSSCYGTCPEYNLELDRNGNLKFHGSHYCKKNGNYEGKLSKDDLSRVEDIISYLNLKNDSNVYLTPVDAPETMIKVSVNNKEFYYYGYQGEFQYKMQVLMDELFAIAEKTKLKKTNNKLYFKSNIELYPVEKTIDFLPPVID